tara:strand:- start:1233 stop:1832 length:600 start_codon:yes stop_codon:yes gene_type:complete
MTIKSDLNLIFPIPVWTSLMPNSKELNQKLFKYIKSLQASNPKGKYKSNIKGWHSEDFNLKNEDVVFFINSISESLNKTFTDMGWDLEKNKVKITSMWSIINKKDASNSRHIHSNNYISAAYYVKASENSGDIIFYDPVDERIIRNPKIKDPNKLNSNVFSIEPKEGLLVLFPSYLHHSVDINTSNEERIVISFNIDLI